MTSIIILVVLAAVVVGLGAAFGGPLLGAVLAVAAVIGVLVWLILLAGSKTGTAEVVRETHEQAFFGPGGPDDPNR